MTWTAVDTPEDIHVVPDEEEHPLVRDCWCEPDFEDVDGVLMVSHRDWYDRV